MVEIGAYQTEDAIVDKAPVTTRIKNGLWVTAGTISLGLGLIGIVLPILPTTPFLLLTAGCYYRGSPRMHKWLLNNKYFGEYIRNWQEGRGIPLRVKITAIILVWITIGFSTFFILENIYLRILLLSIATVVSIHIARFKTLEK